MRSRRALPFRPRAAAERLEDRTLLTAYVVDTLADTVAADGKVSLREAIQAANTNLAVNEAAAGQGGAVTDAISFAASLSGGTITLGGTQLTISENLNIAGLGADRLTISGNNLSRVIEVEAGVLSPEDEPTVRVELRGLTITRGRHAQGGGVANAGVLTITACAFTANTATEYGGAVFSLADQSTLLGRGTGLSVSDSTFSLNTSGDSGGAIWAGHRLPSSYNDDSQTTLSVANSRFVGNRANGERGAGGAISHFGTTSITGSLLDGNSAGMFGGGVDVEGRLTIEDCTISRNSALGGGGVSHLDWSRHWGDCTIRRSTISGNLGGGVASMGNLLIADSVVSGNRTAQNDDRGGGINNYWGGLTVTNSTISGNVAALGGGGIYSTGFYARLRNVTVTGNRAILGGTAARGGGVEIMNEFSESFGRQSDWHNSLVAGNFRGPGLVADDVISDTGLGSASSNNLIGHAGSAAGLVDGAAGNIVGIDWRTVLDPTLRDNGGPTLTHRLLPGSAAINAGDNARALGIDGTALTKDQRGGAFNRILQNRVDIGAFEAAPAADLVGFLDGRWWVGASTGVAFTTTLRATWAAAGWDALGQGDFNRDGRVDAFGFRDGEWWVGLTAITGYATSRWAAWASYDWQDARAADLDGDGRDDVLARVGNGWWAALSTGTGFAALRPWGTLPALAWREFFTPDLNGDGKADLLGFAGGRWWACLSTGTAFQAPKLWAGWSNSPWQKLLVADFDGDRRDDVAGLLAGSWWVGLSRGTGASAGFVTSRWATWSATTAWTDPVAGDFDGDGRDDVAARLGGQWWASISTGTGFGPARIWGTWSNASWQDVRVADFDGDGRDDVAGRLSGGWWVGRSAGTAFQTTRWAVWSDSAWQAVGAVDATGPPAARSTSLARPADTRTQPLGDADDEPLSLFWSIADEDETFLGALSGV